MLLYLSATSDLLVVAAETAVLGSMKSFSSIIRLRPFDAAAATAVVVTEFSMVTELDRRCRYGQMPTQRRSVTTGSGILPSVCP